MDAFWDNAARQLSDLPPEDAIHECGAANVRLLRTDPDAALKKADANLRVFPFKDVRACWRRLYTDASVLLALRAVQNALSGSASANASETGADEVKVAENFSQDPRRKRTVSERDENAASQADDPPWLTETVRLLDMTLIMTGGCGREELIERLFDQLELHIEQVPPDAQNQPNRTRKRVKRSVDFAQEMPATFPTRSLRVPDIEYPVKRCTMTMPTFQDHLNTSSPSPLVVQGAIDHWSPERQHMWSSPEYLLRKTLGGRRLVPVELGRSYTDEDWGQKIMPFRKFMEDYLLTDTSEKFVKEDKSDTGIAYLAQHDLFAQIPALRKDIAIPDLCYTDPPDAPIKSATSVKETKKLDQSLINAWFGPAGTISPLHTDPYHNILCQVVGQKYVRLYAPSETTNLEPKGIENGVDMSNTSAVPVEVVEMGALGADDADEDRWERFQSATYVETVLSEMESLYIPVGWWHYVRSLSVSCSVSFWWN